MLTIPPALNFILLSFVLDEKILCLFSINAIKKVLNIQHLFFFFFPSGVIGFLEHLDC